MIFIFENCSAREGTRNGEWVEEVLWTDEGNGKRKKKITRRRGERGGFVARR